MKDWVHGAVEFWTGRVSRLGVTSWLWIHLELERTRRVRIHAVLLSTLTLMLTFDLSTKNYVTCRICQGHSLYQVWTLWHYSDISVKNALIDPVTLTFDPKTVPLQGYPKSFSIPSLNTLASFVFELRSGHCGHLCEKCTYWHSDLDLWTPKQYHF